MTSYIWFRGLETFSYGFAEFISILEMFIIYETPN